MSPTVSDQTSRLIDFVYRNAFGYVLNSPSTVDGLGDWRYDEFRLSSDGSVIHEIEWAGFPADEAARWCITASDVEFHWTPI